MTELRQERKSPKLYGGNVLDIFSTIAPDSCRQCVSRRGNFPSPSWPYLSKKHGLCCMKRRLHIFDIRFRTGGWDGFQGMGADGMMFSAEHMATAAHKLSLFDSYDYHQHVSTSGSSCNISNPELEDTSQAISIKTTKLATYDQVVLHLQTNRKRFSEFPPLSRMETILPAQHCNQRIAVQCSRHRKLPKQ